jgi:hypothetical protein
MRHNNSWALHHDKSLAHASLIVQHLLGSMKTTFITHPPYSLDHAPVILNISKDEIKAQGVMF